MSYYLNIQFQGQRVKRHHQVSVLVESYAVSLANWFLALREEILVSSSSIEVLNNRLYHFYGLRMFSRL